MDVIGKLVLDLLDAIQSGVEGTILESLQNLALFLRKKIQSELINHENLTVQIHQMAIMSKPFLLVL